MTLDELRAATQAAWNHYLETDAEMRRARDEWSLTKARLDNAELNHKIEEEIQRRLKERREND